MKKKKLLWPLPCSLGTKKKKKSVGRFTLLNGFFFFSVVVVLFNRRDHYSLKVNCLNLRLFLFTNLLFIQDGGHIQHRNMKISAQLIHNLLLRQVVSVNKDELWFCLEMKKVAPFSMYEFTLVTGLNPATEEEYQSQINENGFPLAIQVWAFESIPQIANMYRARLTVNQLEGNGRNVHMYTFLEIDFCKATMFVYDPDKGCITSDQLKDDLKSASIIVPLLLKEINIDLDTDNLAIERNTKTTKQAVSGDCDIYVVKYIEFLSINGPIEQVNGFLYE
ncbi:ubiquitin-like-specific protease 1A [Olea europaea subsp. europaea]|uniref:Ubiquitin-like-specific protease 1A n=1 Tax=Olea europaea subsp. europaea TaxID=158383 RepID=A0A8S0VLB7_OLEEU|nr:ubiquitin-like-specific protease 1A [Olea europaea subsp. europaea]